jgi:hypothetical protein
MTQPTTESSDNGTLWTNAASSGSKIPELSSADLRRLVEAASKDAAKAVEERLRPYSTPVTAETLRSTTG